jgi:predicted glycosyltransferase
MKIWIDLTNSPHINFFKPFIQEMESEGHEIILTCRDLANTIDLIKQNNYQYTEIGGHAGKNTVKKIFYFPMRVWLLWKFLRKSKPDLAISHSSFYSPLVAFLLRRPSIYINDNEHAKGNYIAFKFATLIFLPEFLTQKAHELKWPSKYNIKFYPGIKEGVYLSKEDIQRISKNHKKKPSIYIRPEPWTAQYYKGGNYFFDDLLNELAENYAITLLPRGKDQAQHYKNGSFKNINVMEKALLLKDIIEDCDMFIGAGGTMTREIAYTGLPTISIYQDALLEVDKFLIDHNFMYHFTNLKKNDVDQIINDKKGRNEISLKGKGIQAYELIRNEIFEHGNSPMAHFRNNLKMGNSATR